MARTRGSGSCKMNYSLFASALQQGKAMFLTAARGDVHISPEQALLSWGAQSANRDIY